MASFAVYRKDKGKGWVPLLHPTEAKPIITEEEAAAFMLSHTDGHTDPDLFKMIAVADHPSIKAAAEAARKAAADAAALKAAQDKLNAGGN